MELREAFDDLDDLAIVYVLPSAQMNHKTFRFLDELGLRERIQFAVDPDSHAIDRLGIRKPDAEAIEIGVPHPTTVLLDRDGVVRFADVRRDFHIWLDPSAVIAALNEIP